MWTDQLNDSSNKCELNKATVFQSTKGTLLQIFIWDKINYNRYFQVIYHF